MIRAYEIRKSHGGHEVLRGASLEVAAGEVAALIGPSGSGKTTLLRCLNGLEPFDGGEVQVAGRHLRPGHATAPGDMRWIRQQVGMVFQHFHLFPHLSVMANITLAPRLVHGQSRDVAESKARSLLERVGMGQLAGRFPHQLSGGQQQRVAIARALAMSPEVLLFDEPTSSLDPGMTREVLAVISDLASTGQTMLVVTHAMHFARQLARTVHVLLDGIVIESGPPEQIFNEPRHPGTARLLAGFGEV